MSRELMEQSMRELGFDNDPTMQAVVKLLYATDDSSTKSVNDQLARIGRMHKALGAPDAIPACGERRKSP